MNIIKNNMFTKFIELPLLCKIEILSYLTVEEFEKIKFLLDPRSIQDVYHIIALQARYLPLKEPKMPWSNYVNEIELYKSTNTNRYQYVFRDEDLPFVSYFMITCWVVDFYKSRPSDISDIFKIVMALPLIFYRMIVT